MAAWKISISKCRQGDYQLQVKLRGSSYRFNRALPPDFSDFVSPQGCDKPGRKWRRASVGKDDNDLLFCAADLATLKEIGGRLYESLFRVETEDGPEDLTNALLESRSDGLDLQLDLTEAPDLGRVPWEALYLARKKLLLGVDSRINIVRRLESDGDQLPPADAPPIRMLVAVANPDSELQAKAELGNIALRLGSLPNDGNGGYDITTLERATRVGLQDQIAGWRPHIIHFIGHGGFDDEHGLLYLHSGKDPAQSDAIDSETLRDLVREHPPWLAVLNSCLSGAAARADPFGGAAQNLIQAGVPFVVAMQAPISDDAAIRFSQRFYEALANGETVATAVTRGRNGIRTLEDQSLQPELITPVLYSSGKAERIAFAAAQPEAKPESASVFGAVLADFKKSGIAALIVAILGVATTIWFATDSPRLSAPHMSADSDLKAFAGDGSSYGNARPGEDYAANAVADLAGPAEAAYEAAPPVVLRGDRESRRMEADAERQRLRRPAFSRAGDRRAYRPERELVLPLQDQLLIDSAVATSLDGAHNSYATPAETSGMARPYVRAQRDAEARVRAAERDRRARLQQAITGSMSGALAGGDYSFARPLARNAPLSPNLEPLPPPEDAPDRRAEVDINADIGLIPPTYPALTESAATAASLGAYGRGGIESEEVAAIVAMLAATVAVDRQPAAGPAQDARAAIAAAAVGPAPATYPPCSATLADRCIQVYERRRR